MYILFRLVNLHFIYIEGMGFSLAIILPNNKSLKLGEKNVSYLFTKINNEIALNHIYNRKIDLYTPKVGSLYHYYIYIFLNLIKKYKLNIKLNTIEGSNPIYLYKMFSKLDFDKIYGINYKEFDIYDYNNMTWGEYKISDIINDMKKNVALDVILEKMELSISKTKIEAIEVYIENRVKGVLTENIDLPGIKIYKNAKENIPIIIFIEYDEFEISNQDLQKIENLSKDKLNPENISIFIYLKNAIDNRYMQSEFLQDDSALPYSFDKEFPLYYYENCKLDLVCDLNRKTRNEKNIKQFIRNQSLTKKENIELKRIIGDRFRRFVILYFQEKSDYDLYATKLKNTNFDQTLFLDLKVFQYFNGLSKKFYNQNIPYFKNYDKILFFRNEKSTVSGFLKNLENELQFYRNFNRNDLITVTINQTKTSHKDNVFYVVFGDNGTEINIDKNIKKILEIYIHDETKLYDQEAINDREKKEQINNTLFSETILDLPRNLENQKAAIYYNNPNLIDNYDFFDSQDIIPNSLHVPMDISLSEKNFEYFYEYNKNLIILYVVDFVKFPYTGEQNKYNAIRNKYENNEVIIIFIGEQEKPEYEEKTPNFYFRSKDKKIDEDKSNINEKLKLLKKISGKEEEKL